MCASGPCPCVQQWCFHPHFAVLHRSPLSEHAELCAVHMLYMPLGEPSNMGLSTLHLDTELLDASMCVNICRYFPAVSRVFVLRASLVSNRLQGGRYHSLFCNLIAQATL